MENIQTTPETKKIVSEMVETAIKRLMAKGLHGLAHDVARKDPVIRLILQMLKAGESVGLDIKPWEVPRINSLIQDRLAKALYTISPGWWY